MVKSQRYFGLDSSYWDSEEEIATTPLSLQAEVEADIKRLYEKWGVFSEEDIEKLRHSRKIHLQQLYEQIEKFKSNYQQTLHLRLQSLQINDAKERLDKLKGRVRVKSRVIKNPWIIASTLILLLFGGMMLYASGSNNSPKTITPESQEEKFTPPHQPADKPTGGVG